MHPFASVSSLWSRREREKKKSGNVIKMKTGGRVWNVPIHHRQVTAGRQACNGAFMDHRFINERMTLNGINISNKRADIVVGYFFIFSYHRPTFKIWASFRHASAQVKWEKNLGFSIPLFFPDRYQYSPEHSNDTSRTFDIYILYFHTLTKKKKCGQSFIYFFFLADWCVAPTWCQIFFWAWSIGNWYRQTQ